MGLFAAIFTPALGLILLWPFLPISQAHPIQREVGEVAFLRLDPSSLTNRGGRPPNLTNETSAISTTASPKVEVNLHMGGASYKLETAGATLREGLAQVGIFPKPSDLLRPDLDTSLHDGINAYLQESLPVVIYADGGITSGYTLRPTVGAALTD
ncbi:MAG: hypothetical protein Q8P59_12120, partial [Dehalococcoidia bacterium]|nr:hypothetical protein [Dehalococcoidia bacterium]